METVNFKVHTVQFVDAEEVFSGFEDVYEEFFLQISTADDPLLSLGYVQFLQSRMERMGIEVPKELAERLDAIANKHSDIYIDLEPMWFDHDDDNDDDDDDDDDDDVGDDGTDD